MDKRQTIIDLETILNKKVKSYEIIDDNDKNNRRADNDNDANAV